MTELQFEVRIPGSLDESGSKIDITNKFVSSIFNEKRVSNSSEYQSICSINTWRWVLTSTYNMKGNAGNVK